jgi:hypothetical protein
MKRREWVAISVAFLVAGISRRSAAQTPAPATGQPQAAAADAAKTFTAAQLDQLLAPIALYPDPLLAQILMAATYPLEVLEAANWSKGNPNLTAMPPWPPSRTRAGMRASPRWSPSPRSWR